MEAGIYDQLAMNKKHRTDSSKYWVTRVVLMHGFGKTSLVFFSNDSMILTVTQNF